MTKRKVLLVGNGGREAALAWRFSENCAVFAIGSHVNPSIANACQSTGGKLSVGDYLNPGVVADFAASSRVDLAFVANDNALAVGVVDALRARGIATVGATQSASRIEWDKAFARQLLQKHLPDLNPKHWIASSESEIDEVIAHAKLQNLAVVVKPQGLTSGKGVKVMGEHLPDFSHASAYAKEILKSYIGGSKSVVIEEKLEGVEFTLQAVTDGLSFLRVPATYDFPYLLVGDRGPGTGGMGAFCGPAQPLPFISEDEYSGAIDAVKSVLGVLEREGIEYSGVLNAGFFATNNGLRVMEFNARFGDPECINIMSLLDSSLLTLSEQIASRCLKPEDHRLLRKASVVKYLVAPEYATDQQPATHGFGLDEDAILTSGARVFFAASERTGPQQFQTVGASRCVAIGCVADTLQLASDTIEHCIEKHVRGPLRHRSDIGTDAYSEGLGQRRVG